MSENKRMYVDFHVLQTVPPSCVNRDDTGSPKTAVYGGTMRARVSSQAWKRAMRMAFRELFAAEECGYRTRNTADLVAERLLQGDGGTGLSDEQAKKLAVDVLELAGVKSETGKDVLFFVSAGQIAQLAPIALEYAGVDNKERKDKKSEAMKSIRERATIALYETPSIDMLLFGRMAAGNPSLNYDAAAQVAHSISTHTISNEYDYFTAVDDRGEEDNAGAGHLGTVEYNSSTLYRYATVNAAELAGRLTGEELSRTLRGFAEAFIRSMPTGKQNTFANRTLPDLVYVTLRRDQPVNLAGAFEQPVTAGRDGTDGYVSKSARALFKHARKVYGMYVSRPEQAWLIGGQDELPDLQNQLQTVNLQQLLQGLGGAMDAYATGQEG